MADNILEKEQLDTKEPNIQEPVSTITVNDSVQVTSDNVETELHNNIIDNESPNITHTDVIPVEENTSTFSLRKYIPIICISIGILLFISIFSTIFAILNLNNSKIIKGITINEINLSGLTSEEANQKLSDEFSKKLNSTLSLNYGEYKLEIIPSQDISAKYSINEAVKKAYSIGRSGNLIQNNYEILLAIFNLKSFNINLEYNTEDLNSYIEKISVALPGLVEQPSHYIEGTNLIILPGKSGIELLKEETVNLIISNIETLSSSNAIDLPIQNVKPNKINITKIFSEVYSEPKNAYIIKEPFELNTGSPGIDFAITLDEAENLIKVEKDEYIIPLKITPPEIGVEDLGNDIFIHTLGDYSSKFNVYNYNRTTNVNLATQKINNVILLPGETFSYNKVVGKRTVENGFKEASVYTSSGVVNGLGGGICQVSSTLYNAVLEANLEIVERKNHSYAVSYVPLGQDATVSYGSIDFRFKNNRKYPIKVIAYTNKGNLTVLIKGLEEEVEYDVSITTKRLKTIPYSTKYIEDSSMLVGTQKETQYGDNGYKYETYKTLTLNGTVISTEKISTDNYIPLTRIVRVGTKQLPVVTPPVETPVTPPSTDVPIDENTNSNVPPTNNENSNGETTTP